MTRASGFRKSTFSGVGNCVEVACSDNGAIAVRDSKNPTARVLTVNAGEWDAFIVAVRADQFNT